MLTAFLKLMLYFRTASLILCPVLLMPCEITYKVINYDYRCILHYVKSYHFQRGEEYLKYMKTRFTLNSIFTEMTKLFEKKGGGTLLFYSTVISSMLMLPHQHVSVQSYKAVSGHKTFTFLHKVV